MVRREHARRRGGRTSIANANGSIFSRSALAAVSISYL